MFRILCQHRSNPYAFFIGENFPCLHWKALLTASVFRNPNPPFTLGIQILSQAIKFIPFSVLFLFYRNSLLILSNFSVTVLGNWKHCIVCAGNASRWDWISTAGPTLDKQLDFQPSSLVVALLIIPWNILLLVRCWTIEHPRYFPNDSLCDNKNSC